MLSILLISSDLTGKNSRESLIGGGLKLEASGTQTATVILRAEPTHYLPESSLRHGLSHYKKKQQNLRTLSIQTFQRLFPLCFRMGPLQLWQIPSLSKLPITSVTHHVVICNGSKSFLWPFNYFHFSIWSETQEGAGLDSFTPPSSGRPGNNRFVGHNSSR